MTICVKLFLLIFLFPGFHLWNCSFGTFSSFSTVIEPQRPPSSCVFRPGWFLGYASAVNREHKSQVWWASPAQGQQLETPGSPWEKGTHTYVSGSTRDNAVIWRFNVLVLSLHGYYECDSLYECLIWQKMTFVYGTQRDILLLHCYTAISEIFPNQIHSKAEQSCLSPNLYSGKVMKAINVIPVTILAREISPSYVQNHTFCTKVSCHVASSLVETDSVTLWPDFIALNFIWCFIVSTQN